MVNMDAIVSSIYSNTLSLFLRVNHFIALNKLQCPNHSIRMKRQLVINLICFKLGNSRLGIEKTAFVLINSSKNLIVSYWSKDQVVVVLNTFSGINHKVEPFFIYPMELSDTNIRVGQQRLIKFIYRDYPLGGIGSILFYLGPLLGLLRLGGGIESLPEVGILSAIMEAWLTHLNY